MLIGRQLFIKNRFLPGAYYLTFHYDSKDKILTAYLPETLATSNCAREEELLFDAIKDAKNKGDVSFVYLDAINTTYISSVGIRLLIKLQKSGYEVVALNVSPTLYEILTMTGIDNVISVFPPFAEISIDESTLIGGGRNGKVYKINEDQICKVFLGDEKLKDVLKEKRKSKMAFQLGLPTALSFQVVKVKGSYGLIYEMIDATTISEIIKKDSKNLDKIINDYVNFLLEINKTDAPSFPDKKADYSNNILKRLAGKIEKTYFDRLSQIVNHIPDNKGFVHGDLHFANLFSTQGELFMIDLDDAGCGDGIWDIVALQSTLVYFRMLDNEDILHIGDISYYKNYCDKILEQWASLRSESKENIADITSAISLGRVLDYSIRHNIDSNTQQTITSSLYEKLDNIFPNKENAQ